MSPGGRNQIYTFNRWEVDLGRRELRSGGVGVPLGGRAFDIIDVLVQSDGRLVTKDEITAIVWPGVVVTANTLQVHMSAIRKALGPDRGLLRTASGRGYRLLGPWTAEPDVPEVQLDASGLEPRRAATMLGNLPAVSELIGRTDAVQQVRDLLSAYRFVTITGEGGIGKTRLALEVAQSEISHFDGDVWLVELASLSAAGSVAAAVARILVLPVGRGEVTVDMVARGIGSRRTLIVLDNCEHVIDSAAALADMLVRSCPRTIILATSRERLRGDGECVYRLVPLDVPRPSMSDPRELLKHSAMQLFIARMRTSDTRFDPTPEDLRAIAVICRKLDGMPLAIEFAAARTVTLGIEPVLSRLNDRFTLLNEGRRTALPRHQTLRATLDWSYRLLPAIEQRLMQRLAVFPSSFVLDAVFAVTDDFGEPKSSVVGAIASLVEKSLVQLEPGLLSRWRLLETTRSYAREQIEDAREIEHGARRHAEFFSQLFDPSKSTGALDAVAERMDVYDNVRVALTWAFSANGDINLAIALTAAYGPIWIDISLIAECRDRIEHLLKTLDPEDGRNSTLRMHLLFTLGLTLLHMQGFAERTETVFDNALDIAARSDDVGWQLRILWAMWAHRINNAEHEAAEPLGNRFFAAARRSGDPADIAVGERVMGSALHYRGNQPMALRCYERVLEQHAASGNQRNPKWRFHDQRLLARARLARVQWLQGCIKEARRLGSDCVEEAERKYHKHELCLVLAEVVCPIALAEGDLTAARSSIAALIDAATRHSMTYWVSFGRCHEGVLLIKQGDLANGLDLLRSALAVFRGSGQTVFYLGFVVDFTEALARAGRRSEAKELLDETSARHDRDGQLWCAPELRRLRGELLLEEPGSAAESCFLDALALSRRQGALFWELRTALSLARLRVRQGRPDDARAILRPVYDKFMDGHQSTDILEAKALLNVAVQST